MNQKYEAFKAFCKGKSVALIGMGVSNRAAVDFLLSAGARVTARDKNAAPDEALLAFLSSRGIEARFGEAYLDDLHEDIILRSPGIRPDILAFEKAKEKGQILTSEMEIFTSLCPAKLYAVTGSDGKTTTTTLIAKMLEKAAAREGARVFLGGNIGTPLLPHLPEMTEHDYAVLELSSFQLQTMPLSPDVCVVTNITPNHLNWHTDMEEYIRAKKNIFANAAPSCRLVLNAQNGITRAMKGEAQASVTLFSSEGKQDALCCYLENGVIYYEDHEKHEVMARADIKLPGRHNAENYMAAIAAVHGVVTYDEMREVARSFAGVSHRIELVLEKDGVRYYNSSIDTSPTRTMAALSSFEEKLIVIVGGYDKHIPIAPMIPPLAEKAKAVIGTGDTGLSVLLALKQAGFPRGALAYFGEFDDAVSHAIRLAKSGDIVLLSPAAASFDAFKNFEARGERFRALVTEQNRI